VMADIGKEIVQANMGKIFEESDGAIVFKAEKYDPKLHTRVFMTSQGLPTYETKELGLSSEKFKTEPNMHLSITITANEQEDYMKVVSKALSLIHPEFENKMLHITHGMMRFATGKMASRKGNVVTGEALLNDTKESVLKKIKEGFSEEEKKNIAIDVGVAAIKYSILKQSIGGDIIFDFEKSISFEGDSGPYLQYSFARANSVIEKAKKENILPDFEIVPEDTTEVEKLLYRFPEIVFRSALEYEPHYITNYLIEIARAYNSFYGNTLIVDKKDKASAYKVALSFAFSFVMKTGLHLLGIKAPEKM
ncbi:MAG: arginine--tRNA ligase, partial [Minisyncoccia bacterium]